MNGKKSAFIISGIIMLALVGVVCIFSIESVKRGGPLVMTSMQGELRNTIEIPMSQAKDITIAYTSDNLKIYPADGDKVIIKEYLSSKRKNALATVDISDGKALVTGGEREIFAFWLWISTDERIEIYLPKEGLGDVEIITLSGNVTAENDVQISADKVTVSVSSGNVRMQKLRAEELVVEAKSGNVTVEAFSGSGSVQTKSGNVKVEAKTVTGNLSMQAGSGNVKLVLPTDISFDLEAKTGSGNIRTDYDSVIGYEERNYAKGTVGDAPVGKIFLQAGSGNVSLRREE